MGNTHLEVMIVLITSKNKNILGKNIKVLVKDIGVHHMIGEIIQ